MISKEKLVKDAYNIDINETLATTIDVNKALNFLSVELDTTNYLPQEPTYQDLFKFRIKKLKSKRLQKKFYKNPYPYISKTLAIEFNKKRWNALGRIMSEQIYYRLNAPSFTERIFNITPITEE